MSFEDRGVRLQDYDPVTYPGSVLRFRGPEASLDEPYVLCIGGSETFGQFIAQPYAAKLNDDVALSVVNMGVLNGGLDVLMTDPAIISAIHGASAVVLQVTGAQNMNNRFYSVHPRRNDRFLKATRTLRSIYHDVDFTEFHFTRHLLTHLESVSSDRFTVIVNELQAAWQARMERLIDSINAPVHLVWLSNRHPEEDGAGRLGGDPLFVTNAMLQRAAEQAQSLTISVSPVGIPAEPRETNLFAARRTAAARLLPGPEAHDAAAEALKPLLLIG